MTRVSKFTLAAGLLALLQACSEGKEDPYISSRLYHDPIPFEISQ